MSLRKPQIPGYTGFRPSSDSDISNYADPSKPTKHIPGYKGFVPGIKAENVYANTFGRTTN